MRRCAPITGCGPPANAGIAHENGAIEGPHGHLKGDRGRAPEGTSDFANLPRTGASSMRSSGTAMPVTKRIDSERASLQDLPISAPATTSR